MNKKVMDIKRLNVEKIMTDRTLEDMFQVDFKNQEWVWVNRDIFFDILYNAIEYDAEDEENLKEEIKNTDDDVFSKVLTDKFKEIGWVSVHQKLFENLVDDFIATKDIETFIYMSKRFYAKKIIQKMNELSWVLKAMAIDAYQHLALENKTLIQIYEEYFNENGMIIEEILITEQYKFNSGTWKLDRESNSLEFYKMRERYHQWSEGNSNFVFNQLSK